ncbi:MAG TPA: twin-arginine translocation signal domain-containing protein [Humisphaera sp.]
MRRRDFLRASGAAIAGAVLTNTPPAVAADVVASDPAASTLRVDPTPKFDLSPWLYMQMMEPLGTTDGSVEAAWDHLRQRWRPDVVTATKELAPTMVRWGGLFAGYYRWREGVGPRAARQPMHNLAWGGVETNQVGTAEFLDFCSQVGADPLMCVNFEAEGDPGWAKNPLGEVRAGDANEAADWVRYCNDPDNRERISHGRREPMPLKVWQLGNETSYNPKRFGRDAAIAKTIEFAKAMHGADPSLKLVGWGDSGWAPQMVERTGEHLFAVAFHHLYDPGRGDPKSPLREENYHKDPAATWAALMDGHKPHAAKIAQMRQQVGEKFSLALTECHYTFPGRNRCDVNSAWAVGVSYARFLNLHARNGDLLKIANLGDFCGTRWQTNVVMIPTPGGRSYLMPVGRVMALFRKHVGKQFVEVAGAADDLDVVASRTGDTLFLHVVNTHRTASRSMAVAIAGAAAGEAKAFTIAADPTHEVWSAEDGTFRDSERAVPAGKPIEFPAASVSAVEVRMTPAA